MSDDKKKSGFANTHYPGITADPNEGQFDIPKEALDFLKPQIDKFGLDAQRAIWRRAVLLVEFNSKAAAVIEQLVQSGVARVGVLTTNASPQERDEIKKLSSDLRSKYSWLEFEPFIGLSLAREPFDVLKGFQLLIDFSEGQLNSKVQETAIELKMKVLKGSELPEKKVEHLVALLVG
ncbi:MAG TPA: hypothetical protein PLH57_10215 [Oligoflexia bacterium]|nr:hypothetical protein [Oligoflexia bacterium]